MSLTKSLRWEIQSLGQRLAAAANAEESMRRHGSKMSDKAQHDMELKQIVQSIRRLLHRIEDAVPLINLAITASGASLSSTLPTTVSPSRLLQASTFLTAGDSMYATSPSGSVQIGPTFTLSLYMLFAGHLRPQTEEDVRQTTWKEVIHKADVKLMRVPLNGLHSLQDRQEFSQRLDKACTISDDHPPQMTTEVKADEYAYQLVIVEDLEDDRVHSFEEDEPQPGPYGDITMAGIRVAVPIHQLSKIFYADTGKILNIGNEGENNAPVLLLKRDPTAVPPRRMMERLDDENDQDLEGIDSTGSLIERNGHIENQTPLTSQEGVEHNNSSESDNFQHIGHARDPWRLPSDLDPEWIAFEVYTEAEDSDSESELENPPTSTRDSAYLSARESKVTSAISHLAIDSSLPSSPTPQSQTPQNQQQSWPSLPPIRTSLSLLETLLRLLSLQQFQQTPHLSIPDELLTFFLSESATTGAASNDAQQRKQIREEARRRVGFDPYDESPIKRRGEDYQYRADDSTPSRRDGTYSDVDRVERLSSPLRYDNSEYYDEGYETHRMPTRSPSVPTNGMPRDSTARRRGSSSANPNTRGTVEGHVPSPLSADNATLQ